MIAATNTANVTIDPNAIYNPRLLRGAGSGTTQGAAGGAAAALNAVSGAVGGKFCGKGGGIPIEEDEAVGIPAGATVANGTGIGIGVSVFVADTASGNACPNADRNASAV
jgi:hypothetical protein